MNRFPARRIVFSGLCIALGVVLPVALHSIPNAGSVLLPMHIPVLLCGLACGWQYGLACGVITPLVSSLITGMPPAPYLLPMICELAVYGLLTGVMRRVIHVKPRLFGLYIQLITAMLAGRVVYGIVTALIFQAGTYSIPAWLTGVFVVSFPGIIIQLVLIPAVVLGLEKARLIENAEK